MLECTSIPLNTVCQVGHSRKRGGVSEGVGSEGVLITARVVGDDVLIVGPHEGAGQPGWSFDTVILVSRHHNRCEVAI